MTKSNQHVVPHQGDWAVRGEGNSRVTSIHPTQSSAFEAAREVAINNHSEVITHRPNGTIRRTASAMILIRQKIGNTKKYG